MKRLTPDQWLAITVLVAAAVYLYLDSQLPEMAMSGPYGPRAFPALIGAGLIFSALLLLKEAWDKKRTGLPADSSEATATPPGNEGTLRRPATPALLAILTWTLLYYICFEPIGYVISTTIFLIGLLSFFHRGHHLINASIAVGFTLAVDVLFSRVLATPMPTGILFF